MTMSRFEIFKRQEFDWKTLLAASAVEDIRLFSPSFYRRNSFSSMVHLQTVHYDYSGGLVCRNRLIVVEYMWTEGQQSS